MGAAIETKADWLAARRSGIGASEVGTILGLNEYDSPYALWLRKTGQIPDQDESLAMWLGHEMEPVISKRYEMETGRRLIHPGDYTISTHPDYPWLRATLDRETTFDDGRTGPVELKAVGAFTGDEWKDGNAPLVYQAQLQIQMACTDAEVGEIAAIIGNREFHIVRFDRNEDFLEAVIPLLYRFYECMVNGTPPEIDGSNATAKALAKLHPNDNGDTVDLPAEIAADIALWQSLKAEAKEIEERIQYHTNRIKAAVGDNTFGQAGGLTVSLKTQTRKPYTVTESCTYRVLRKVGK